MNNTINNKIAKPFLKWAGGKGQLLNQFNKLYPKDLSDGKITTYIEPFVGGGAVLFDILQKYEIENAVIIDLNKELINCYKCIKQDVLVLINQLEQIEKEFLPLSMERRTEYYLQVREKYNSIRLNGKYDFEKAADLIFLNKTCFNGLYRVNGKGGFNVPFGKYKNPKICDRDNLLSVNNLLQKVEILYGDYFLCKEFITQNSFIYYDPPYRPLLENYSFVSYAKKGFNDEDQKKLADFVRETAKSQCKIMLSNSDPKNVNSDDNFFDELYYGFDIKRLYAKRMINCQADKRGDISEIVVRNYKE